MEPVRSPRNPRVVEAIRLHRRRRRTETGRTLLEGPHLIDEAIRAGTHLETIFVSVDDEAMTAKVSGLGADAVIVSPSVMAKIAGTQHPRGPVAVMAIPPEAPGFDRSLLVSWGVGDPGNVGTLIRSAAAFGLGFLSGPGTADPWSPKVLRAGAGAHFRTSIERPTILSVASLQERGYLVVAAVVTGGDPPRADGRDSAMRHSGWRRRCRASSRGRRAGGRSDLDPYARPHREPERCRFRIPACL